MPPQPGESTLLIVFADVHYLFSRPEVKPPHQRFDKGSYVYLFQKPPEGTGRLEIANHAGTPDQDAIAASLQNAHIIYSYKKSCVFTFKPNGQPWQLPAFDIRNEKKYLYGVQEIQIYFWTSEAALKCLDALKQIHGLGNLEIQHAPPPPPPPLQQQQQEANEHRDHMSPVIQQLETAAISVQTQGRQPSVSSIGSPQPLSGISGSSTYSPRTDTSTPTIQATVDATAAFAPIPYNPAAPAAPETRTHREKTPPPPDPNARPVGPNESSISLYQGMTNPYLSTGLSQQRPATMYTGTGPQSPPQGVSPQPASAQSYFPPGPPTQQGGSFPPPPPQQSSSPSSGLQQHGGSFAPPPQQQSSPPPLGGQQQTSAFPPPPPSAPPASSTPGSMYHSAAQIPLPFSPPPTQSSFNTSSMYQKNDVPLQSASITGGFPPPPPLQSPGLTASTMQTAGQFGQQQQQQGFPPPPTSSTPTNQSNQFSSSQQGQQQQPSSFSPPPGQGRPQTFYQPPQISPQQQQPPPQAQMPSPQQQSQAPVGGYSNYSYTDRTTGQQHYDPNAVHNQVYRPTQAEASSHPTRPANKTSSSWSARSEKAEKGVNRFLKKLEKF